MQISVGPPTKTEPPPLAITPWGAERGLSPQTLRPVLLNNVTLVADSPTVIKSAVCVISTQTGCLANVCSQRILELFTPNENLRSLVRYPK